MRYFYSANTGGFYVESLKQVYEENNSWPDDLIAITTEEYNRLLQAPEGLMIAPGPGGTPELVPNPDYISEPEPTNEPK